MPDATRSIKIQIENQTTTIFASHIYFEVEVLTRINSKNKNVFSVQYHPEANPGPYDSEYLFDQFIANIEQVKKVLP